MKRAASSKSPAAPRKHVHSDSATLWPFAFRTESEPATLEEASRHLQDKVANRAQQADAESRAPFFTFGAYQLLYRTLLRTLYYTFGVANGYLARRKRIPHDRPIRVLRMTSTITQGGVAKVCVQTILKTPPQEVETHLLVFTERRPVVPSLGEREDVTVICRRLRLWPCSYKPKLPISLVHLARILRRVKPDLIHLHEPQFAATVNIAAGMAGGYPVVIQLHSDYNSRERSIHRNQLGFHLHALRHSRLIACSHTIAEAARRWLGEGKYPITLIEDGTNDVPDRAPDERLSAGLAQAAGGRIVVAKMARLVPFKRIDDFLKACRALQKRGHKIFVLLMCYGKEKDAERMRLKFDGLFAPHEGEFLYKVIAPQHLIDRVGIGVSASSLEGLGLNVLEYQVRGVPVVCSDLVPHREMVEDGKTGLLFPVGDVAALTERLERLLGDEALRRRLGEAGRAVAQERTWERTARKTVECYRQILER